MTMSFDAVSWVTDVLPVTRTVPTDLKCNFQGRFLDLLVNWSVSKPSVNFNSLVKFVHVSEQNLTGCQLTER